MDTAKEVKRTAGPWTARQYCGKDDSWFVRGPSDERVCGSGSGHVIEANARLIAAAPDLLGQHESTVADLEFLRRAITEGDPKAELLIRIDDILRRTQSVLSRASLPTEGKDR